MRIAMRVLACGLLLGASAMPAQRVLAVQKNFENEVLNKRFFLQGQSGDPQVDFTWTDFGVKLTPPHVHTLAVVVPDSVRLLPDTIEIRGTRWTLAFNLDGHYILTGGTPVLLSVALQQANPSKVFPLLKDQLFYRTADRALAAIPALYKGLLPYRPQLHGVSAADTVAATCPGGRSTYTRPRLLSNDGAPLSPRAQALLGHNAVTVLYTVDESGHVVDPWLAIAGGGLLDQEVVRVALQLHFSPATCGATPVAAPVNFEANQPAQSPAKSSQPAP